MVRVTYETATGVVLTIEIGSDISGSGVTDIGGGQSTIIVDAITGIRPQDAMVDVSGPEPVISARPGITHGWSSPEAGPVTLGMSSLPAGTSITATNEAGQGVTTDDPADPIILADAEAYRVSIDPPWPYLPETLTIEVT